MAVLTITRPPLAQFTTGVVTVANLTLIRIVAGTVTQDYNSNGFAYSANQVVGGTVTSSTYSDSANGGLQYSITGLKTKTTATVISAIAGIAPRCLWFEVGCMPMTCSVMMPDPYQMTLAALRPAMASLA